MTYASISGQPLRATVNAPRTWWYATSRWRARLITETMPHVRSVTLGVADTAARGHESDERGIAHFVEHMLFKGTDSRPRKTSQAIDSIGGQLDAFTAKEYASYYIKVLDEHVPLAVELLSDIVRRPAFVADEIEREKKVILEEIKMVEDTPGRPRPRALHQHFWEGHRRPHPRQPRNGRGVEPRHDHGLLRPRLRRAEHDHLGGGASITFAS